MVLLQSFGIELFEYDIARCVPRTHKSQ